MLSSAFAIFLTVLFATTLFATTAVAQTSSLQGSSPRLLPDSSITRTYTPIVTLDDQLASLLKDGNSEQQSTAMMLIIEFRRKQPNAYDFTACIEALLQVYRSDQSDGMRLLSLAALNEIGTDRVHEGLRQAVTEVRSQRVRRQTAIVLHYAKAGRRVS